MIVNAEFKFIGFWYIITPTNEVYTCNRFNFEDDYKNTVEQAVKQFGEETRVLSESEYAEYQKG